MINEMKIEVPKKYHGVVESIRKVSGYNRYRVILCEGYLAESLKVCVSSALTRIFFARSQKEVLAFIRSARAVETVPILAPEGTAVKEELTNVEETANGKYTVSGNDSATAVSSESTFNCLENLVIHSSRPSVKQYHVPSAVAVDAPETAPDQERTAPVVDDRGVAFTNCIHKNHEGYCNLHSDGIDYLEPCVEAPCPDECIPELQPP